MTRKLRGKGCSLTLRVCEFVASGLVPDVSALCSYQLSSGNARVAERGKHRDGLGAVKNRCGFSAIELLVALSVVTVLLALALPAIAKARSAARRAECQSHLKNLALAMTAEAEQGDRKSVV